MKKKVPLICNIVSLAFVVGFVIKSVLDYFKYSSTLNSAPFSVWLLVNALCLITPAIIMFAVGKMVKKKG